LVIELSSPLEGSLEYPKRVSADASSVSAPASLSASAADRGAILQSISQPGPVLVNIGLPGTWATSCNAEASTSNWVLTFYSDGGGRALRRADRGADEPSLLSVVDSAQVLTPTTFLMRIRTLMALLADRGIYRYEIGCARISIMVRST
jgi:hypothetical protein